MPLDALLRPRSVAVVGASERPSPGRGIIESLGTLGFGGAVYPINPNYRTLLGHPCYPSLAEIPGEVDLVAFCIGNARLLESYRIAAEKRVGAAVIYAGGFGEATDDASRRLNAEIVGLSREAGITLCGPNCMGVLSPASRSIAYLHDVTDPAPLFGNVGFVSQSGSICIGLLADCRRFGFSHVISSGNEAVTTSADYLEFLIEDPNTAVIATFTETIREPDRFVALLDRAADRGKPVVMLKTGKSERAQQAITTHTGGLAGEAKVLSAVLRAHRAIEVEDLDELTEVLAVCQGRRWPRGRRLAVVTGSGGQAELILDVATAAGLDLPPLDPAERAEAERVIGSVTGDGNPLDAWGTGDFQTNYAHALSLLGKSERYDAVAFCNEGWDTQPLANPGRIPAYGELIRTAAAASEKPFYYMSMRPGVFRSDQARRLLADGIPTIGGARQGLAAIDRLARWATPVAPLRPVPPPAGRLAAVAHGRAAIHEHDAKTLLAAAGLPVAAEALARTPAEAAEAAARLGYPVALKAVSDAVAHKSDLGLVKLGLRDGDMLAAAWRELDRAVAALSPRPELAGMLVQRMVPGGVEVFAGITRDPDFGLVLAFGLGGIHLELSRDVALRPLPLRVGDAAAMIAETRVAAALLAGVRGQPPADVPALVACLEALADFAAAEADALAEIDLNPIKILPEGQGCVVLDALIVPRRR